MLEMGLIYLEEIDKEMFIEVNFKILDSVRYNV
jgi:hypothetical protein